MPPTLLHGDFKYSNLGLARASDGTGERVVMLDWQDSTPGPPLLDLGYFLAVSTQRLSLPKDEIIEIYRSALAAHGANSSDDAWRRAVELGLLGGGALRLMWQKTMAADSSDPVTRRHARDDLEWWFDLILRAARWFKT
jgi:aminoglycoside phosphotransferase (APT) family kinase protein